MAQVNFENLASLREKHKNEKIVFCSGSFDLLHAGHVLFFEDCKKLGDILVVGVGTDKAMRKYKGDERPILNENLRMKIIDSLSVVDYVFLIPPGDGDPLDDIIQIYETLKPDFYAINEDASDIHHRQKNIEKFKNIKMVILKRWCPEEFENISTTKIIEKIKNLGKES